MINKKSRRVATAECAKMKQADRFGSSCITGDITHGNL